MTLSLRASASGRGGRFDHPLVFAAADAARYQAKGERRDRVSARELEPLASAV